MKARDALEEVAKEMQVLAHYLRLVSRDEGTGAETADSFSHKLLQLQLQIEERLQALTPGPNPCTATSVVDFSATAAKRR